VNFYVVIEMTQGELDFIPFPFISRAFTLQKVQGMFQRLRCIRALFIYPLYLFFFKIQTFSPLQTERKNVWFGLILYFLNFILHISGFFYTSKPINKMKYFGKNVQD